MAARAQGLILNPRKLTRAIKRAGGRGATKGLRRGAQAVVAVSKGVAPVDSGSLKSSIHANPIEGRGWTASVWIGPNVKSEKGSPYDIFQEYGTYRSARDWDGNPFPGRNTSREGLPGVFYMKAGAESPQVTKQFIIGWNSAR